MLDLSLSANTELPVLRIVEGIKLTTRFVALSHCWGDGKHLFTTSSSLEEHKRGIPRAALSKNFQDAIEICRFLGIYLLWIDSLCIVQDNKKDWERESQKMGHVYQYAHLVISADAASDGSVGCFTKREVCSEPVFEIDNGIASVISLYARTAIEHSQYTTSSVDQPVRDPLSSRAWVLQEWLLARRVLQFSQQELIWDCRTRFDCECEGFNRWNSGSELTSDGNCQSGRGLRSEASRCLQRSSFENHDHLSASEPVV